MRNIPFYILFFYLCIAAKVSFAQEIPPGPSNYIPVHDYAKILKNTDFKALTQKMILYEDSTSTQIIIVILDTLTFPDIVAYGNKMFKEWKIGQKGTDNGLLLLVALKNRKIRFEVGYGLEAKLPDIYCDRLIKNEIGPRFRKGEYYQAFDTVINLVIKKLGEEFKAVENRVVNIPNLEKVDYNYLNKNRFSLSKTEWQITIIAFFVILLLSFVQYRIGRALLKKKSKVPVYIATAISLVLSLLVLINLAFYSMEEGFMALLVILPIAAIITYFMIWSSGGFAKFLGALFSSIITTFIVVAVLTSLLGREGKNAAIPIAILAFMISIAYFIKLFFGKKIGSKSYGTRNIGSGYSSSSSSYSDSSSAYSDSRSSYSDYSDYSDYKDYSDSSSSSMGGGSSGGGGATGSW